jgi:hypothetical protein
MNLILIDFGIFGGRIVYCNFYDTAVGVYVPFNKQLPRNFFDGAKVPKLFFR